MALQSAFVHLFTSHFSAHFCTQILLLSWATSTHCKASNNFSAALLTVKRLDIDTNNFRREKLMSFILWNICLLLFFFHFPLYYVATAHLQAQFQLYQTWHHWCNSQTGEEKTQPCTCRERPLYAGAKPIIHVEICLGKLGSTLENKQPETRELCWCFRALLMSCRLMEALHADILQRQAFFFSVQDITPLSIVFILSWQNGF